MSERATDKGACPRCEQVCRLFEYSGAGLRVQCDCVWECGNVWPFGSRTVWPWNVEGGTWPSWANRVRGVVVAITRGRIAALLLHYVVVFTFRRYLFGFGYL